MVVGQIVGDCAPKCWPQLCFFRGQVAVQVNSLQLTELRLWHPRSGHSICRSSKWDRGFCHTKSSLCSHAALQGHDEQWPLQNLRIRMQVQPGSNPLGPQQIMMRQAKWQRWQHSWCILQHPCAQMHQFHIKGWHVEWPYTMSLWRCICTLHRNDGYGDAHKHWLSQLVDFCFGNYAFETMLRQLWFGNSASTAMLRQPSTVNYASVSMLLKPCFRNYVWATMFWRLRKGNYAIGNEGSYRQPGKQIKLHRKWMSHPMLNHYYCM